MLQGLKPLQEFFEGEMRPSAPNIPTLTITLSEVFNNQTAKLFSIENEIKAITEMRKLVCC